MEEDVSGLIHEPITAGSGRAWKTGGQKRLAANALPRTFLLWRKGMHAAILGAIVVHAAYEVTGCGSVTWQIGHFAKLEAEYPVTSSNFAFRSSQNRLILEVEPDVRGSKVTTGDTLNHNFSTFSGSVWPVVAFEYSQEQAVLGHGFRLPFNVTVNTQLNRALGIQAETVDAIPDPLAQWEEAAANASLGCQVVVSADGAASSGQVDPCVNIAGISHDVDGAVSHRYAPGRMIDCMLFASHLRPGADMSNALVDGCRLLQGEDQGDLRTSLQERRYPLPSIETLRNARTKLDICMMMFERLMQRMFVTFRYICTDSSPLLGWNFLMHAGRPHPVTAARVLAVIYSGR